MRTRAWRLSSATATTESSHGWRSYRAIAAEDDAVVKAATATLANAITTFTNVTKSSAKRTRDWEVDVKAVEARKKVADASVGASSANGPFVADASVGAPSANGPFVSDGDGDGHIPVAQALLQLDPTNPTWFHQQKGHMGDIARSTHRNVNYTVRILLPVALIGCIRPLYVHLHPRCAALHTEHAGWYRIDTSPYHRMGERYADLMTARAVVGATIAHVSSEVSPVCEVLLQVPIPSSVGKLVVTWTTDAVSPADVRALIPRQVASTTSGSRRWFQPSTESGQYWVSTCGIHGAPYKERRGHWHLDTSGLFL